LFIFEILSLLPLFALINVLAVPQDNIQAYGKIISDLKARKFYPIYLLHGEESYFIDQISNYIENNALTEAEKAFNQTVFYAKDVEVAAVVEAAKRYPMMANFQVIIVKEAQSSNYFSQLFKACQDSQVKKANKEMQEKS
jgi:DNA polymerase III delta subunit